MYKIHSQKKYIYVRNSLDSPYTKRKGIKSVNTFAWSPTIYHIHYTRIVIVLDEQFKSKGLIQAIKYDVNSRLITNRKRMSKTEFHIGGPSLHTVL